MSGRDILRHAIRAKLRELAGLPPASADGDLDPAELGADLRKMVADRLQGKIGSELLRQMAAYGLNVPLEDVEASVHSNGEKRAVFVGVLPGRIDVSTVRVEFTRKP